MTLSGVDAEMIVVEGMDHHAILNHEGLEHNKGEVNAVETLVANDEHVKIEPYLGMEFVSEDAAKNFYDDYARQVGFTAKLCQTNRSKSEGNIVSREFSCYKEGLKKRHVDNNCDAFFRIELRDKGRWVVTKFVKEHSHSMGSPSKVHYLRPRRHFAGTEKSIAETYEGMESVPSGVMHVSMDGNRVPREKNRGARTNLSDSNRLQRNAATINYTVRTATQRWTLGRDTQNLLEYFKKMQAKNPGFFYAIQLDEENRMANVFWADSRSRSAYSYFGDAVTLDTTSRVNQFRVPFAPFTGMNHHGQIILFGCALLLDDSEASFLWLFKTFLTAMNDRHPVSIVTDQDRVIQTAVSQVFPEARHCISKWHVLREGQDKLSHVYALYPNFQIELYNCTNLTETIDEFDATWSFIIAKYDLTGNDWLQTLYNARAQWVPAYFRDSFFAVISPNQGYEGSFFEGYVNQQTTLPMFIRQYERVIENCFEKEIEADFDTMCTTPLLRTPSPMEKQAASLCTRKIFAKFQEELVETFVYTANRIEEDGNISTFRVAKFEDDQKAYIVTLNHSDMRATCSCHMFEYSGILCRHVLTVFTVTNVLTLPPHYILKRWTGNARSGFGLDEHVSELHENESLSSRYNNICREAIKYAEEGAIALETYNVAMSALKEGWKKLITAKRNVAKIVPPSSYVSGIGYDERKTSTSASDSTPSLWPGQDDVTRQFNLNDVGASSKAFRDLNLPRMDPVSLHRDESSAAESMVVLPCLKSMTWVMESKNATPGNKVAVINLKLQDYSWSSSAESEVKFQLSSISLEPMLRSMAYISEQLSTPANKVAVINLKLQDTETTSGESEVKFQVSRDTLGAMLRSMAYIREQLSSVVDNQSELSKKQRK